MIREIISIFLEVHVFNVLMEPILQEKRAPLVILGALLVKDLLQRVSHVIPVIITN